MDEKRMLAKLQRHSFQYFINEADPHTGLIADKTQPGAASSITATGMGLTAYIIGVERKYLSRKKAISRVLTILRFFYNSEQGKHPDASGYKGFYYHFLNMKTGRRDQVCELSTIDTALFIAGVLAVGVYFTKNNPEEAEIRELSDKLYRRVNWKWALGRQNTICHGWKPGSGFLPNRWDKNYSEAIILYILALGSPTFPISAEGYLKWASSFELTKAYGVDYLYAGPLFIHQFSHLWIDFRNIHDAFNRKTGFDYFENSSRATQVHRQYAIENHHNFEHYNQYCWGLTASNGPGRKQLKVNGRKIKFYDYISRGVPYGPDDGTISPSAVIASLPFAPAIVIDTIQHAVKKSKAKSQEVFDLTANFNPAHPVNNNGAKGWVSPWKFGLNQGPVVIMIENYQSELIWKLMKHSPYIRAGLERAGFTGGWLGE
ncbi:MAG: glucoamylase family protein [Ferruginibacter sp.]